MSTGKAKAGQWGKRQAWRYYMRIYTLTMLFMTALGFAFGYAYGAFGWQAAAFVIIPTVVVFGLMANKINKMIDGFSKRRINYMRGAQAEALVAWLLHELPESYRVFNNLPCAKGGDLDHVVVGPSGLYVLSTKSYKGHVTRSASGTILLNGRPLQRELEEAQALALWLATRLKSALGDRVPWVQPVLVLPRAKVDVPPKENNVWLLDDENLVETLHPDKIEKKTAGGRVQEIVAELERVAG